jgi:agmatinase
VDPMGHRPASDAGIFGLTTSYADADLVIVPVPWDATASYGQGAAEGPEIVLSESHQIDLLDPIFGAFYRDGIYMLPIDRDIGKWNHSARMEMKKAREAQDRGESSSLHLAEVARLSTLVHGKVRAQCQAILRAGKKLGVLGGDHSTSFGPLAALAEVTPEFGILHIDAHHDLRDGYEGVQHSHAAIMRNVLQELPQVQRLVSVGIRDYCQEELQFAASLPDRVRTYYDHELAEAKIRGVNFAVLAKEIISSLPGQVYISLDIDGLDPSLCPGTGTPVPGGLNFHELSYLLKLLAESGKKIVGFDLNEVAPGASSSWNGNIGARVLFKLCGSLLRAKKSL